MLTAHADEMLRTYSRTFYEPICQLPGDLKLAVAAAYLAMRAIDEIEDSTTLDPETKVKLLSDIHNLLRVPDAGASKRVAALFANQGELVLDVTHSLPDWIEMAPSRTLPYVLECVSNMSNRMAFWVKNEWRIPDEQHLNMYTFDVAGTIGILLSQLFSYYCGCSPDVSNGVRFGIGLQLTNIALNRKADLKRGVDFFPPGWDTPRMIAYARSHFPAAHAFIAELNSQPAENFCKIPLDLAEMSVSSLEKHGHGLRRKLVEAYFATGLGA